MQELLAQEVLKLSSDTVTIALDVHQNGKRTLPLFQFSQGIVDHADRDKVITDGLHSLLEVSGLSNVKRAVLTDLVQAKVLKPGPSFGNDLLDQVRADLRGNVRLIRSIIVKQNPILDGKLEGLELSLEEVQPGVQRFETNLNKILNISDEEQHKVLATAVSAVTNLNQRIAQMQDYNAISLFEDGDASLLFGKIGGVLAQYDPSAEEKSFLRILDFTGIPQLLDTGKIDVGKLLEVRDSKECREFRAWLQSADKIDDDELRGLLTGFRAKASCFIASPAGKVVRFAVNVGLGLIPGYGSATSLIEGALDTFLLDKLLPSSGVLSFLSQSIPSVIDKS
ncbi:MAG: hypothetical protein ABI147_02605 [Acidobacteriaceae bacterium]